MWRSTYRGLLPDELLAGLDVERRTAQRTAHLLALRPDESCLVADVAGEVAGFATCGAARGTEPAMGEVYAIYVRDEHQRVGVGSALLGACARRLHDAGLGALLIWVLRENAKGRAFYERMGGRAERERPYEVGGVPVVEIGYVWRDTGALRAR